MSSSGSHDANHPAQARLAENRPLNGTGSAKDTRHIAVDLGNAALSYVAGDSLGVLPRNDPALVAALLARLGIDGGRVVSTAKKGALPLAEVLACHEITRVPKGLVPLAAARGCNALAAAADNAEAVSAWCSGRDLLDLLEAVPTGAFTAEEIAGQLKVLPPRLYSIASGPAQHPRHVHLTVGAVRWESHGRRRGGVCSTYLADRIAQGGELRVFVHTAKNFRLPADGARDIIMVGPGTGIAPFRGFLQERAATGATGRNWLFFGDQKAACDFLYADELRAAETDGRVRLSLAFSRDQAAKVYVQHRMEEQAAELWSWLAGGAHFYVCGDALRMAKDVDETLHRIACTQGGMDADGAAAWIKALKKEGRYQRDVYAV